MDLERYERELDEDWHKEQWAADKHYLVYGIKDYVRGGKLPRWAQNRATHYGANGRLQWGWPPEPVQTTEEQLADALRSRNYQIAHAKEEAQECIDMWTREAGWARRGGMYREAKHHESIAKRDEAQLVVKVDSIQRDYANEVKKIKNPPAPKPKPKPEFWDDFSYPDGGLVRNDEQTSRMMGAYLDEFEAGPDSEKILTEWYEGRD